MLVSRCGVGILLSRFFIFFACAMCLEAEWHFGLDASVGCTFFAGDIDLIAVQEYSAGYDVYEDFKSQVFLDEVVGNLSGIFHQNTQADARAGYLLKHAVPQQVADHTGAPVNFAATQLNEWLFVAAGDVDVFDVSRRSVEASTRYYVQNIGVSLMMHARLDYVFSNNMIFGLWCGFRFLPAKHNIGKVSSSVARGRDVLVGDEALPVSVEAKAYEPFDYALLTSKGADFGLQEKFRLGASFGYLFGSGCELTVLAGMSYVYASSKLIGVEVSYPYAHRTYKTNVVNARGGRARVSSEDIEMEGNAWGPLFALMIGYSFSEVMHVSVSGEYVSAKIDLLRSEEQKIVKNPLGSLRDQDLKNPDGWHMTYVDSLAYSVKMKAHVHSFTVALAMVVRV